MLNITAGEKVKDRSFRPSVLTDSAAECSLRCLLIDVCVGILYRPTELKCIIMEVQIGWSYTKLSKDVFYLF